MTQLRQASPLAPRWLGERLNDSDENVREAALDALLALEPATSVAPLQSAFERGSPDIRRAVLIRLGRRKLGATPDGRRLLDQALNDDTFAVRYAAFWISVIAYPTLLARLGRDNLVKIIEEFRAQGVIGAITDSEHWSEAQLEPLFAALACRQPDMALQAALCLSWLGDERALSLIHI